MQDQKLKKLKEHWELALQNAITDSDKEIIKKRIAKIADQLGEVAVKQTLATTTVDNEPVQPAHTEEELKIIDALIEKRNKAREMYNMFQDEDMLDDLNQIEEELKKYNLVDTSSVTNVFLEAKVIQPKRYYNPDQLSKIMSYFEPKVTRPDESIQTKIRLYKERISHLSKSDIDYWDSIFDKKDSLKESELVDIILRKQNLKPNSINSTQILNTINQAQYECLIVPESFPDSFNNHIYKRRFVCQ
jgi:CHAD domain-containing protein